MVVDAEMGRPFGVAFDFWTSARLLLDEKRAQERQHGSKKKNNGKKPSGRLILHLTYSLKDRKFIKYDVQKKDSNLFFEFAVAINEDIAREYLVIQMEDEDLDSLRREALNETRTSFSYDVDPLRELILRNGFSAGSPDNEEIYHLIGCSNSQIAKHTYFFRRSSGLKENETHMLQLLPGLHELERTKGIPKRVKYAGLLFSGIQSVSLPDNVRVAEILSIERYGYDFTDGPGLISKKLANWVHEKLNIRGDCPSVFQIRYCGTVTTLPNGKHEGKVCKGVLVVDPRNDESYEILVRASMLKINASPKACKVLQNTLGICDYSQSSPGRLGQQLVCLVSGTVEDDDFMRIQKEHLDCVQKRRTDPFSIAWLSALDRNPSAWSNFHNLLVAEKGASPNHDCQQTVPSVYTRCVTNCDSFAGKAKSPKDQLPIAASRTLFGAVFPELLHDILNEGECIVLLEDGPLCPEGLAGDNFVIVSRSPSYYPGDVRVLRVIDLPGRH